VQKQKDQRAQKIWQALHNHPQVVWQLQTRVAYLHLSQHNEVEHDSYALLESRGQSQQCHFKKLLLATGARERLLPFPGWTLPGVTGAGGLQALAKAGYPVRGKRIVIAGTGPLLLAVAASLQERGAIVTHILEQTSISQLSRFAAGLLFTPSKIQQAFSLQGQIRQSRYRWNSFVRSAELSQSRNIVLARAN